MHARRNCILSFSGVSIFLVKLSRNKQRSLKTHDEAQWLSRELSCDVDADA